MLWSYFVLYYVIDGVPTWVDHLYASFVVVLVDANWFPTRSGFVVRIHGRDHVLPISKGSSGACQMSTMSRRISFARAVHLWINMVDKNKRECRCTFCTCFFRNLHLRDGGSEMNCDYSYVFVTFLSSWLLCKSRFASVLDARTTDCCGIVFGTWSSKSASVRLALSDFPFPHVSLVKNSLLRITMLDLFSPVFRRFE